MPNPNYYHRTIIKKQIESEALEKERPIWIYLPPGYNELLSYPVLYCQDGLEFLNFGRVATWANTLILDENVEPFLIVGVEVDLPNRTAEYSPEGSRYSRYKTFFTDELMPFVAQNFPVRTGPDNTVLAGDSLGATVSLHLALDRPNLFRKIISLSGAYYPISLDLIGKTKDFRNLDLYMLIGLQETHFENDSGVYDFLSLNRKAKTLLENGGASIRYKEAEGGHIWGFWQKELPDALRYFFGE
jgi:enterochelin esterase-like enzyme